MSDCQLDQSRRWVLGLGRVPAVGRRSCAPDPLGNGEAGDAAEGGDGVVLWDAATAQPIIWRGPNFTNCLMEQGPDQTLVFGVHSLRP